MTSQVNQEQYQRSVARLYHSNTGRVVGAGFLVSEDLLFTCAHVIASVLPEVSEEQSTCPSAWIPLDFPFEDWQSSEQQEWTQLKGKVVCWYPVNHSPRLEDIALVKLEQPLPANVQPIEISSTAKSESAHLLKVLGFPKGKDRGIWAEIKNQGETAISWLQLEDERVQGCHIEQGFSGTPVLNTHPDVSAIIGMVVARDKKVKDAEVAYAIPQTTLCKILAEYQDESVLSVLEQLWGSHSSTLLRLLSNFHLDNPSSSAPLNGLPGFTTSLPTNARGLYDKLSGMSRRDYPADILACFVACLLTENIVAAEQCQLQVWLEQTQVEPQSLIEWSSNYLKQISASTPIYPVGDISCLLIKVVREDEQYTVQGWFIPDLIRYKNTEQQSRKVIDNPPEYIALEHIDDLKNLMGHYLCQCNQYDFNELRIELFLPRDLLNYPIDMCWPSDDAGEVPFGYDYPVIIRSLDRLTMKYALQKWRKKCQKLVNAYPQASKQILLRPDQTLFEIRDLKQPETLGFFHDRVPSHDSRGELFHLERSGVPVALWVRQEFPDKDLVTALSAVFESPLENLLSIVKTLRAEAIDTRQPQVSRKTADSDPLIGHHLSLLWEDFGRNPPKRPLSNARL